METGRVKACETDKSLRLWLSTVKLGKSLPYERAGQLGHKNNWQGTYSQEMEFHNKKGVTVICFVKL